MKSLFLLFFLAVVAHGQTYPAEANGANPGAPATTNTAAIQTTIDAASAGGTVTITTPGIYLLATQGTNPYATDHKYCLDFKYDNVEFRLGPGVTLKLANDQQVDAGGAVDMLVFRGRTGLTFSGAADGTSVITGNAAGQTGWTGGYQQISNGIIISGYGENGAGAANSNITIRDLWLKDHFSNPVNIDRNFSSNRNAHIKLLNLHATGCGEGLQIGAADDVVVMNCVVDDPNHASVGDAFELSGCTGFYVVGNTAKNHRHGSGFDIFGSSHGVVDQWVVDDCGAGTTVHAFGPVPDPENVVVSNGVILNIPSGGDGVELSGATLNNIKISNVIIRSGRTDTFGFQVAAEGAIKGASTSITIENCVVDGGSTGLLLVAAFPNLTIKGGSYTNQTFDGIAYVFQGNGLLAADVENLVIDGVTATDNGRYGILITNQGYTVPQITGSITNCSLDRNGSRPISAGAEGGGLTVDVTPDFASDFGGGAGASVFGLKRLCATGADVSSFQHPSRNQRLILTACEERNIIDARRDGNNIYLNGGLSTHLLLGDTLTLNFDSLTNRWTEENRSTSPAPPNVITQEGGEEAIALNASTFVEGPFPIETFPNFAEDKRTRVMLFVANLSLAPGETTPQITAQAEDALLRTFPLTIEHIGPTSLDSLTEIVVLIPEDLYGLGEIWVSVNLNGVTGNRAKLTLRP